MSIQRSLWTTLAGCLGICLAITGRASSQQVLPAPEGIDVQTRGPLHEAFAEPVQFGVPAPGLLVPRQPPEPVPELPSEMKPEGDNVLWIPGYWSWDSDRNDFLWVSGFWRQPPPDRRWVPGYWTQAANGWRWAPGFWAAAALEEVAYLQPPPAPLETGPSIPAPNPNSTFVNGTWVHRDSRYLWRPGYWVTPQPGWVWVPARYVWTPMGCVFVDGYWDYVPDNRGLLYAPVVFQQPLWRNPGWSYRPSFAVQMGGLLSSLFVRPGTSSYYFGDYYGANYANLGYQPWFQYGTRNYDPLFSYYRWHNRGDEHWIQDLNNVYQGRLSGALLRPPRTLVQQQTLVQQNIVNKTVVNNRTVVNNLNMVTPVAQLRDQNIRLTRASAPELTTYQEQLRNLRQVVKERAQAERPVPGPRQRISTEPSDIVAGKLKLPPAPVNKIQPVDPGRNIARPEIKKPPTENATPATPPPTPGASIPRRPQPAPITPKPPPAPHPNPVPRLPVTPVPKTDPAPIHKAQPAPKAAPKPQPTPVQQQPKPEPKPQIQPAPKPQPAPVPQQPKPEPKPQIQPAPKPQPTPVPQQPRPEPKPQIQPAAKPQPAPVPQQPKPEPKPQIQPAPRPQPTPAPPPEPKPQIQPAPRPQPTPVRPATPDKKAAPAPGEPGSPPPQKEPPSKEGEKKKPETKKDKQ